jgi:23S rRNA pseudouridine1911/1915/1917 synthase
MLHRLDRETSGLMVLAKTSKAAARLSETFRVKSTSAAFSAALFSSSHSKNHINDHTDDDDMRSHEESPTSSIEKEYLAVVHGHVKNDRETLTHNLQITTNNKLKDQKASLSYQVLKHGKILTTTSIHNNKDSDCTWLQVHIHTGRKHQIRAQLSHIGHPIVGDFKYGAMKLGVGDGQFVGIALHARALRFKHPVIVQQQSHGTEGEEILQQQSYGQRSSDESNKYQIKEHKYHIDSAKNICRKFLEIMSDPTDNWSRRFKLT